MPVSRPTPIEDAASSTLASAPANDSASTTVAANPSSTSTPTVEPPPQGLTLVHIVGTKYIDYFTDGTTVTSCPGDPHIDCHFDVPNAPIPTHAGLTWDHTSGGYLYDTPSGNLEVGEYAVRSNGSYIENVPPFVSSTSTPVTTGVASHLKQRGKVPNWNDPKADDVQASVTAFASSISSRGAI